MQKTKASSCISCQFCWDETHA